MPPLLHQALKCFHDFYVQVSLLMHSDVHMPQIFKLEWISWLRHQPTLPGNVAGGATLAKWCVAGVCPIEV